MSKKLEAQTWDFHILLTLLHGPSMLVCRTNFVAISGEWSIISPTFLCVEEISNYWSVQFFSVFIGRSIENISYVPGILRQIKNQTRFQLSPSNGKPRMTLVSFVKTTEPYEVCDWIHIWVIHLPERIETDRNGPNNRIGPDCMGHA